MISVSLQWVDHPARVEHFPDDHFVTLDAYDADGTKVSLFFADDDGTSELAVAEAWLRDALAKVEVAKIDAANDQTPGKCITPGCVPCSGQTRYEGDNWACPTNAQPARIGEPLDLTAVTSC